MSVGIGGSGGAFRGVIPRSNVGTVGGDTGGGGVTTGAGVGVDGAGTGAPWHDVVTIAASVANRRGMVRIRWTNVGRSTGIRLVAIRRAIH